MFLRQESPYRLWVTHTAHSSFTHWSIQDSAVAIFRRGRDQEATRKHWMKDEKKKSFGNLCALKLFSGNREGDSTYIETAVKQNVLIMGQMRDSFFSGCLF